MQLARSYCLQNKATRRRRTHVFVSAVMRWGLQKPLDELVPVSGDNSALRAQLPRPCCSPQQETGPIAGHEPPLSPPICLQATRRPILLLLHGVCRCQLVPPYILSYMHRQPLVISYSTAASTSSALASICHQGPAGGARQNTRTLVHIEVGSPRICGRRNSQRGRGAGGSIAVTAELCMYRPTGTSAGGKDLQTAE